MKGRAKVIMNILKIIILYEDFISLFLSNNKKIRKISCSLQNNNEEKMQENKIREKGSNFSEGQNLAWAKF